MKKALVFLTACLALNTTSIVPTRTDGLDLEYTVTISDPASHSLHVRIVVNNVAEDEFVLETSEFRGRFIAPENLQATDPAGNSLPVIDVADSETEGLAWNISMQGNSQVIVDYDVNPATVIGAGDVHGYLTTDFGLAEGQTLFLIPENQDEGGMEPLVDIGEVKVRFQVPLGWDVYVPWERVGEYYYPRLYYPELDAERIFQSLCLTSIVFGGFDSFSQAINGTQVMVATYQGWDALTKQWAAETAWRVFAYQASLFGAQEGGKYLAVFSPMTEEGYPITTGEWSLGHTTWVRYCGKQPFFHWHLFSHGLFHRWNCWNPWGMHGYGEWFMEGPNVFYEMKVVAQLRLADPGYLYLWESQDGNPELRDASDIEVSVTNAGQRIGLGIPLQVLGGVPTRLQVLPLVVETQDYELILDTFASAWISVPSGYSESLPLLATDPVGDSLWPTGGADLAALYGRMDNNDVEIQLDVVGSANSGLRYDFYFDPTTGHTYQVGYTHVDGFADQVVFRLRDSYDRYLDEFANTSRDVPLVEATDTFLIYYKSAMVMLLMAREMYERTDGDATIDDLMHHLYTNCGNGARLCDEEYIKSALNLLTNSDFAIFFDEHIYGATTLDLDWAFEDADHDGLLSAIEVLLDTDLADPDTDGDGAYDGIEVDVGTDPLDPASRPYYIYLPLILRNSS